MYEELSVLSVTQGQPAVVGTIRGQQLLLWPLSISVNNLYDSTASCDITSDTFQIFELAGIHVWQAVACLVITVEDFSKLEDSESVDLVFISKSASHLDKTSHRVMYIVPQKIFNLCG